ncbi:hypothetical protein BCR32DRAFT_284132, partial [Anaeromyces robustus]
EYDDINELLINEDDDETYNNYSRVPTSQESDDETLDMGDNLSSNDYYLIDQEEIPFVNLWSSFSKVFIRSVLRSTRRYSTYEKEIRRNCLISLLAVIATSLIYLIIAIYTYCMDGYTMKNMHDINNYTERAIVFSSLLLIFVSCLGIIGVRFKFKPMIVLYIIMNIISFCFQYYAIKQLQDTVTHAERNLSFAWWDVYTNETKINFQREFNCCGYLDYTDNAVPIDICPESLVHRKVKIETLGPIPVMLKKGKFNKTFTIPDVGGDYFTKEELERVQIKLKDNKSNKSNNNNNNNQKGDAMMDIGIDMDLSNLNSNSNNNNNKTKMKNKSKNKNKTNKKASSNSNNNNNDNNNNNHDKEKGSNIGLRKRKDSIEKPKGCSEEITRMVEKSVGLLCILCWILSISSPFALLFSLFYCKNLELTKKSYEYF